MQNPVNTFKAALESGKQQIGLWMTVPGTVVPEALAGLGYDWICVDTEHSQLEVVDAVASLQGLKGYPVHPVVRPALNDEALIKRVLDLGAQTILVPQVQTPEEAELAVKRALYPPVGIRGVAGVTRASHYGLVKDYLQTANEQICVLVQVETGAALARLDEIAQVKGVGGVFIGPADLAASLGHPGNPNHPDVRSAIEGAIVRLKELGVPSGILTLDPTFAKRCIELGTTFTAVGVVLSLMLASAKALRDQF